MSTMLTPPASVEQIVAAIERMGDREQQRLLDLSPGLMQKALRRAVRIEEMEKYAARSKRF